MITPVFKVLGLPGHNFFCVRIMSGIKQRRLRWAGHVACKGERRGAYRIFVGKSEVRTPLGRPVRRWEDNIEMDIRGEVEWGCLDLIDVAQDRDRWRAVVNAVMNFCVT
jgi:hypothetical protein